MPPKVTAVLLAAGLSRRMGRPKQLLPLNEKPVVNHCVENILAAGIDDVVVVLGAQARDVAEALRGTPVKTVVNPDPASDMAESVRIGMREVGADATGVLVALVDHPLVSPGTIKALVTSHLFDPLRILIPRYEGRRGHPTIFPKSSLRDLASGGTLRDVILNHCNLVRLIEVDDEGVVLDLDTPEDYERMLRRFK